MVSPVIDDVVDDIDSFCRYGGEEFVAILPQTPMEGGRVAAEKVRKAVESFRFHSRGNRVPVTLSADKALAYGEIVGLLDLVRGSGVKKIGLEVRNK